MAAAALSVARLRHSGHESAELIKKTARPRKALLGRANSTQQPHIAAVVLFIAVSRPDQENAGPQKGFWGAGNQTQQFHHVRIARCM